MFLVCERVSSYLKIRLEQEGVVPFDLSDPRDIPLKNHNPLAIYENFL